MITLMRIETDYTHVNNTSTPPHLKGIFKSLCKFATGRSAFRHLLTCLPKNFPRTVLLPCYIAEGAIKPFIESNYNVVFYKLKDDLTPNEESVAESLQGLPKNCLFLLLHYFGFPSASKNLIMLLRKTKCIIVSDCAHALLSSCPNGRRIGSLGDITLFSLNKILPVTDGAIIISRRKDINLSVENRIFPVLPQEAINAYKSHLTACRKMYQSEPNDPQLYENMREIENSYERYYEIINEDLSPKCQSIESQELENLFLYKQCAHIRRKHAKTVFEQLSSPIINIIYDNLPDYVVPFAIPARVKNSRRDEIIEKMFKNGVVLSTLRDKWDFIPHNESAHFAVESSFLKDHILIPISEFNSDDQISSMITKLNNIY